MKKLNSYICMTIIILSAICFGCGSSATSISSQQLAENCFTSSINRGEVNRAIERANSKYHGQEYIVTGEVLDKFVNNSGTPIIAVYWNNRVSSCKKCIFIKMKDHKEVNKTRIHDIVKIRCKYEEAYLSVDTFCVRLTGGELE